MKFLYCLIFMGLLIPSSAGARPVSYPGGWTIIQSTEAKTTSGLVHYTLDPQTAVGLRLEETTYGDHVFLGAQLNRLVKRWNNPESQANLYLKVGLGAAVGDFHSPMMDTQAAAFLDVSADWENRRWFVSGSAYTHIWEDRSQTGQKARLGVAPYLAEYGALHTWLMVQAHWTQNRNALQGEEVFTMTPLVRFFKGSNLLEIGYSTNDEPLLNFIHRF